jgi:crotonobetainyl-CoA:carnitine CoA-transferase CaiB-like acyl-CoA transferase
MVKRLLGHADVVIQNYRPGVADRLGLGADALRAANPGLIVATISGYGEDGPWVDLPGQDLLAQGLSGVMWLSGSADDGPVPVGLSIADMLAGHVLVEGILAALVRRGRTGQGALVQTSLLEAITDFQFEVLTTHLNDGQRLPRRSSFRSAHAYLAAPYGVYPASDGFLALAMMPISKLADLLQIEALAPYRDEPATWFTARDEIKAIIARRIAEKTVDEWLAILEPADVWCARVLNWREMLDSDGFKALDLLQTVTREDDVAIHTTRSPLRIDGVRAKVERAAPRIGEHSEKIRMEFGL